MEKSKIIFENSRQFMLGKKRNLFLILLIPLTLVLFETVVSILSEVSIKSGLALGIILFLLLLCVSIVRIIVDAAIPFVLINYIDSAHQDKLLSPIASYKIGWKKLFKGFVLILAKVLTVLIGFVAFILPGVYLALSLMFSNYAYMVNKKGIRSSMIYSFHIAQGNFKQIIIKQLYIAWKIISMFVATLISFAVAVASGIASIEQIFFVPLVVVGLAGSIYFLIQLIKTVLISQEYMYEVFKAIEKTKGEIKEEDLARSKDKLSKWIKVSAILAVFVGIILTSVFSALLK